MDTLSSILKQIPLFRHCTGDEIDRLKQAGAIAAVARGHAFNLKKSGTLAVVASGLFEIEAPGKADIVYLSPGSFFGSVPFSDTRPGGAVRAMVDSSLMLFSAEDLYRFFFLSFRSLRGYLRSLGKMGFSLSGEVSPGVRDLRVMTVCGPGGRTGKSFLSALLGSALSSQGRTIVLDLSVGGTSVFDMLGVRITQPLSHRAESADGAEKDIMDRIERVNDGLDVMNVTFGTRVKVDPDILQPLLFLLSRRYRYVIMDCSGWSDDVRDRILSLSDMVFVVLGDRKEASSMHSLLDSRLRDGQRVYYLLNGHFAGEVRDFTGGLVIGQFPRQDGDDGGRFVARLTAGNAIADIAELASRPRRAFVLEGRYGDAFQLCGFLAALKESGVRHDALYASSTGFVAAALYLLEAGGDSFPARAKKAFSPGRFSKLLDVVFPDDHVFKAGPAVRFAEEAAGRARVESFTIQLMTLLSRGEEGTRRMFSTGDLRDLMAASLLIHPIFEERTVAGETYSSGYPSIRARCEDLIGTDLHEIICVAAVPRGPGGFQKGSMLNYFLRHLEKAEASYLWENSGLADGYLLLDPGTGDAGAETVMEESAKLSLKFLKEMKK